MAKNNRFPSDANKPAKAPSVVDAEKAAAIKAAAVEKAGLPAAGAKMAAKAPELVQVHYGKKNHHFMESVHHLAPGLNQVAKDVWDRNKDHPAMKALIKDGTVKVGAAAEKEAEAPPADETEEDSE
jgi:hypothetical protein